MRPISYALTFAMLCSGCSMLYTKIGNPVSTEGLAMEPGKTRYDEVLNDLGPPNRMSSVSDGFAFLYEYLVFREMQIGISGPPQFQWLSLLKITVADVNLRHDILLLHFNSEGVLMSSTQTVSSEDLGMGGSVQPIVALKSVVDTSDYEDDAVMEINWGSSLLRPLPEVLNIPQSLSSGAAGMEQSGTTAKVGQHTLEMR